MSSLDGRLMKRGKKMKSGLRLLTGLFVAGLGLDWPGPVLGTTLAQVFAQSEAIRPTARPKTEEVIVGRPARSVGQLPIEAAVRRGFFLEEGLEVKLIQMRADMIVPAMLNGQVAYTTAISSVANAALMGLPLKVVMSVIDFPSHHFVARPEFKSVKELRGKILGASSLRGYEPYLVKQVLAHYGLDATKDVTLRVIGSPEIRLQAMMSDAIQATAFGAPTFLVAKSLGLNVLVDSAEIVKFNFQNGLAVTDKQLRGQAEQVKKMIRGVLKGLRFVRGNKEEAVRLLESWLGIAPDVARSSYDVLIGRYTVDGTIRREAAVGHIELASKELGLTEATPVSNVVDDSLLRQVQREMALR
jgi:ABC-type nitrate/sulfonate/bicarbonate transport system substrate-binding protein